MGSHEGCPNMSSCGPHNATGQNNGVSVSSVTPWSRMTLRPSVMISLEAGR